MQLFWGTVQVVLLPILVGLALNTKAPNLVKKANILITVDYIHSRMLM